MTVASSVFGYIGTAPSWRRQSRLVWRQGPCHLVEDAFNPQVVQWIYRIGPHYVGSLQAPQLPGSAEALCSLVNEERIVFGGLLLLLPLAWGIDIIHIGGIQTN